MNKKDIKVEGLCSDPNIIFVNGQKYFLDRVTTKKIDKVVHGDKAIYKPMEENKIKKDTDLIVKSLAKKTNPEEIIREILKDVPAYTLRRLAKRIRDRKPIKKQHGCLGFKCGDAYVQLVG
jgi:hypothetical protein